MDQGIGKNGGWQSNQERQKGDILVSVYGYYRVLTRDNISKQRYEERNNWGLHEKGLQKEIFPYL